MKPADDEPQQTSWITEGQVSGQLDLLDEPKTDKPEPSKPQPDWLDDHLEIVGVSDEVAEKIKNRLRREF